jgi:hypothetical protein
VTRRVCALLVLLAAGQPAPFALRQVGVINNITGVPTHGGHDTGTTGMASSGIPDFCASPTSTAVKSGSWSSADTWDVVPAASGRILIPDGITVAYDQNVTTAYTCVGVKGLLWFSRSGTLNLRTSELLVYGEGELNIGTEQSPVTGTATVEFTGTLDAGTVGTPGTDPTQFGVGLIVLGTIRVHGQTKTPYARLSGDEAASQTVLNLATTPSNWAASDTLVVPDSIQPDPDSETLSSLNTSRTERRTINSVSGADVTVSAGLTYTHPCADDKTGSPTALCAHVGNLTRNVVFRSVNPGGTRGHSIFTASANVDVRYALFDDMGRTTNELLHCTVRTTNAVQSQTEEYQAQDCYEGTGTITAIGTNQKGRYPIHIHHLHGTTSSDGYQFKLEGNVVQDGLKWPITIHNSHWGLVKNNIVAGDGTILTGAGIMFEGAGSIGYYGEYLNETNNVIDGNFVAGIRGDSNPRTHDGREGACFYIRSYYNYFRNNIAAACYNGRTSSEIVQGVGYKTIVDPADKTVSLPDFRGADTSDAAESTDANEQRLPFLEFANNEAYGAMSSGMTIWNLGWSGLGDTYASMTVSTLSGFTVWHVWEQCFYAYPMLDVTFTDFVCRGDTSKIGTIGVDGTHGYVYGHPVAFHAGDYPLRRITIDGFTASGLALGFGSHSSGQGTITFKNGDIHAQVGYAVQTLGTPGGGNNCPGGLEFLEPRTIVWQNNLITTFSGGAVEKTIYKAWTPTVGNSCTTILDRMSVIDYQQTTTDFSVYYIPQGTSNVAGEQASCNDTTTYPAIFGVVCS